VAEVARVQGDLAPATEERLREMHRLVVDAYDPQAAKIHLLEDDLRRYAAKSAELENQLQLGMQEIARLRGRGRSRKQTRERQAEAEVEDLRAQLRRAGKEKSQVEKRLMMENAGGPKRIDPETDPTIGWAGCLL
jgi:chromosome segregation ATPase